MRLADRTCCVWSEPKEEADMMGFIGAGTMWMLPVEFILHNTNLKQNEAQSARAESTHKGS